MQSVTVTLYAEQLYS